MDPKIFALLSAVTLVPAALVVTLRNLVHAAIALIVSLLGVAGFYLFAGSEFLFAVQILLYIGGVVVLILFVVMLTYRPAEPAMRMANEQTPLAAGVALASAAAILWAGRSLPVRRWYPAPGESARTIGRLLLTDYVLPFEVASILLLSAMVGAIVLTQVRKTKKGG